MLLARAGECLESVAEEMELDSKKLAAALKLEPNWESAGEWDMHTRTHMRTHTHTPSTLTHTHTCTLALTHTHTHTHARTPQDTLQFPYLAPSSTPCPPSCRPSSYPAHTCRTVQSCLFQSPF